MGNERNEESALTLLLEAHEKRKFEYETNVWYKFEDCYPPYVKNNLMVYASGGDMFEFFDHPSYVFIQHYLMDKYYWGFKDRPSLKKMTHWMMIERPYNAS